jgi:hypothetical protein
MKMKNLKPLLLILILFLPQIIMLKQELKKIYWVKNKFLLMPIMGFKQPVPEIFQ